MRKWLFLLLALCLAVVPCIGWAEEGQTLEQLILQKHFTQKELERNLTIVKAEEQALLDELAQLDLQMNRQAAVISAMQRRAGQITRAYYTGERVSLLTLFFNAKNFNDILMLSEFLQRLFEQDMNTLASFQSERQKAASLLAEKQQRLDKVRELRAHFERQLALILQLEKEKEEKLKLVGDVTSMESLMDHLVTDWRKRGLPAFRSYFGVLAQVMNSLPELVTSDRFKSNGLLTHTLTIGEAEFNEFLASKNEIFKQSHFQFSDNQLTVDGVYEDIHMKIIGHYELVSPTELRFKMTDLYYDGFELPESTIAEMETEYDLAFYPAKIAPNIQVEKFSLEDQELQLQIKIGLSFDFGAKR